MAITGSALSIWAVIIYFDPPSADSIFDIQRFAALKTLNGNPEPWNSSSQILQHLLGSSNCGVDVLIRVCCGQE